LVDIYSLLSAYRERMDWNSVYKIAYEWRMQRNVMLMLDIPDRLNMIQMPAFILESLPNDRFRPRAASWAVEQVLAERGSYFLKFKALSSLFIIPNWKVKIRYLWRGITFVPKRAEEDLSNCRPAYYSKIPPLSRLYFLGKKYIGLFRLTFRNANGARLFLRTQRWLAK